MTREDMVFMFIYGVIAGTFVGVLLAQYFIL